MGNPTVDSALHEIVKSDELRPNTTGQTAPPMSVNSLPQEALELAAKIFDLARTGATQTLDAYLGAGIPANLTNSTGDTLVMLAAYHGHTDTVRMLLRKGADSNVLNSRGQSPLAGAVFKGYVDVVKVLFEEGGAKIEGEHAGHPNAVDCARMFQREDFLELFGVAA